MININITDVTSERPENLIRLGNFLINIATPTAEINKKIFPENTNFTAEELNEVLPNELAPKKEPELNAQEIFGKKSIGDNMPGEETHGVTTLPVPNDTPSPELDIKEAKWHNITMPVLDIRGVEWNPQIHSSEKTKNADGRWKKKRGVTPQLVNELEKNSIPVPPPFGDIREATLNFPQLIKKIQTLLAENKLTKIQLAEFLKMQGIESLALLGSRLELVPAINIALDNLVKS